MSLQHHPTIGLALGAGGAKGFAHVGVLRALEEQGIKVDVISGSSMGGLVGAFYVTGMKVSFMEKLACTLRWRHWVDLTVPKLGLIGGDKVLALLRLLTRNLPFEEAQLPFAVVATNLLTRSTTVLRSGSIAEAVRASIAIPGIFVPYITSEGMFVDGGVLDRVPVAAARQLGADVVIAVDVATAGAQRQPAGIADVILQSLDLMQDHIYRHQPRTAELYIEPDVTGVGTSQFQRADRAIRAGYDAAMACRDDIHRLCAGPSGGAGPDNDAGRRQC